MSEAAVELKGVVKHYGPVGALEGLSLRMDRGETLGLLGHNGAGKTTALKLILGIIGADAGEVSVLGQAPRGPKAHELRRFIGYLPENVSFYRQLSGREVLDYFARLKGVDPGSGDTLLERVGLAHAAGRRVKTYSKGMRQRLGLAQALLGRPQLLLLDEPTVGLDPLATRYFFAILDELRRQGSTIVLCSHVLGGIEQHIDRAAVLADGRLRAAGTLENLRRQTDLPVVIRARGDWRPGTWEKKLERKGIQRYRLNGARLELTSTVEAKMDVMRMLAASEEVQDIEVLPPTLEDLYAHLNPPAGRGEEQS